MTDVIVKESNPREVINSRENHKIKDSLSSFKVTDAAKTTSSAKSIASKKRSSKKKTASVKKKSISKTQSNRSNLKRCHSDLNILLKVKHYDTIDRKSGRKGSITYDRPPQERSRSSSLCRVTGHSLGQDESHYFPTKNDFPYFSRRSSCQITQKHDVLGDRYNFPVFDPAQIKNSEELSCETEPKLIPEKDVLTIKRLLLKNDVLDNPSQILRKKFKEKNWLSSEEMMKNEMRKEDSNRFEAKIEETIQGSQKQSDSCRENYDPFLRSDKKQTIRRFKMNRIDSFEVEKDDKVFNNNKIKICEHNSKRYNNNFKVRI